MDEFVIERFLTLKHRYPLRIGFIADTHVGTTRALSLPEFITRDGQTIKANQVQQILYKHWERMSKIFEKYRINYLFLVGDAFGGLNPLRDGAYRFLDLPDQIELATQLLLKLLGDRKEEIIVLIWRGNDYHETTPGISEMHLELTKRLQSENIVSEFMGESAYVEIEGLNKIKRLFVSHLAPSALQSPPTMMSREINWWLKAKTTKDILPVDAIIRAHLHKWYYVEHDGIQAVQLPCWQGFVPYKNSNKYYPKLQPNIGGVLGLINESGRITFTPFLLPEEERLELAREVIKIKPISHRIWQQEIDIPRELTPEEKELIRNREVWSNDI